MRAYLPLIAEALPVAVVFLLCWRELRQLKKLRLEREARERAEAEAATSEAAGIGEAVAPSGSGRAKPARAGDGA